MTTVLLLAIAAVLMSSPWIVTRIGRNISRSAEGSEQLQAILNGAIDPILTFDAAHRILIFNPAAERMFEWRSSDAIGIDVKRLIQRHSADPQNGAEPQSNSHGASLELRAGRYTLTAKRRDGTEFPIDASISEAIVKGKRLYTLVVKDLTEQRRIHDALRESESRYRGLLDISPVAIWLNRDNRITFANQACLALLGASDLSQVLGKSPFQLLDASSHDRARARIESLSAHPGKIVPAANEKIMRFDGQTRDVEVAAVRLDEPGHVSILVALLDVTQRNLAERELRESHEALRTLARSQRSIREEERARLSEQLHEGLGQLLAAAKMRLAAFDEDPIGTQSESARSLKQKLEALLDEILTQVRDMASELRPPMLDQLGLAATLEWLAQDVSRRYGAEVVTSIAETHADHNVAVVLYRIARDTLESAAREASGAVVFLGLRRADNHLVLTLRHSTDGGMHSSNKLAQQAALISLREQLGLLNGSVETRSCGLGGNETVIAVPSNTVPENSEPCG